MQFQLGRFFLLHQFLDIFHCSLSCICFAVCSACLKCMYSTTYPNRDNSHLHNGLFIMGNHQKLIWMIVRHSEVPVCLTDPDVPPCFHPTTLILYTFDNEPISYRTTKKVLFWRSDVLTFFQIEVLHARQRQNLFCQE